MMQCRLRTLRETATYSHKCISSHCLTNSNINKTFKKATDIKYIHASFNTIRMQIHACTTVLQCTIIEKITYGDSSGTWS